MNAVSERSGTTDDCQCRVVHLMYSFSIGGLENVVVQLINRLPRTRYRHMVLSLTTVSDFRNRIERDDVEFVELHKPPGHAVPLYPRIHRLFKSWRPDVVHSCNLAALEIAPVAWFAGVPRRIHAEHGWDAHDPNGSNPRYRWVRRAYRPFVSHYVSVSKDISHYLAHAIGVPQRKFTQIANGVDTHLFAPRKQQAITVPGCPFAPGHHWLVGTVGRLQTVKNQPLLARAFVRLWQEHPEVRDRARLVIVGDGPLRPEVQAVLDDAGLGGVAWLAGARNDVQQILPALDCFVLPSQAEGTSCTLQEAMSCGLPVVATAVGGTPDLVREGQTGYLVPSEDVAQLANAIWRLYAHADAAAAYGARARQVALQEFALDQMIEKYDRLFLVNNT
jgi:sugar transferase (PEP-CTERM/EpsH1 system associated)